MATTDGRVVFARSTGRGAGGPSQKPAIGLFGALSVETAHGMLGPSDLGGVRPKQVLEILVVARGRLVPTERIADLLWAEPRAGAAASIQTFVSVLRRHLSDDREHARRLLVTETGAYRFATDLVDLDLDRFDELLERSGREPTGRARRSLAQALALAQGEVLEDEPYAGWAQDLRGSYRGRVLGARLDAAEHALAELDFTDALAHTEIAASLDRFSERAHRIAMLALYALGRQHDALARYRCYRALLDQELGLEPTAETRALESAILRQEDPLTLLPRSVRGAEDRSAEPSFRLLGRSVELETLTRAVTHGLEGDLTLIQIEGDGGLGKSRLLDELQQELTGVRVGRAACSELERHLPYVPLATALRDALAGIEIDATELPALGQILPELTLGLPHTHCDELEVLEALVALVQRHAPLVLLLDDAHWADRQTLSALGYLRRRGAVCPGAVVTTSRAAETPAEHGLRSLRPEALVRLEPLTADDLAPLGIPELYETTGGNPRFVAEALATGRPGGSSATLAEALVAHCRAEGVWAYRVLCAASLLDESFEPEPLADLLGADAAELTEELERLCERRVLRVDGLGFRFRYELVRRVLRESISPARRRLLLERLDELCAADGGRGSEMIGPAA
jgi:DNA-binding SARP family transcriptional activator